MAPIQYSKRSRRENSMQMIECYVASIAAGPEISSAITVRSQMMIRKMTMLIVLELSPICSTLLVFRNAKSLQ